MLRILHNTTDAYISLLKVTNLFFLFRRIDRSNSLVESSSGLGPLSPGAGATISALGALQPDLYTKREAPLVIELEGAGPSLGRIHLRLKYDFDRSDLEVHLIEGKETQIQLILCTILVVLWAYLYCNIAHL